MLSTEPTYRVYHANPFCRRIALSIKLRGLSRVRDTARRLAPLGKGQRFMAPSQSTQLTPSPLHSQKKENLICHTFHPLFVCWFFFGKNILTNNTDNALDIRQDRRHFMVNLTSIFAVAKRRLFYQQFS